MGVNITSTNAELLHINIRKEGPEDNQVLAIDIKFSCEAPGDVARQLLGADVLPGFWLHNQDVDPIWPAIKKIETEGEFIDHQLKFGGVKFDSVKISKCSFTPRPKGKIDLVFSASIFSPSDKHVALLAEYVKENLPLSVTAPPDLFENKEAA